MQVAVIGGGFTGLACATLLAKGGADVVLYEKNDKLGGLAAGFQELTWQSTLETYYHHWFKSDSHVFKFAKIWNAQEGMLFSRPSTVIQTESNEFVPLDSAAALLKFPELNFFNKLRMGAALAFLKVYWNWRKLEQVSAEDWCQQFMGAEGFEKIWKPLLVGKFGERNASDVNMAWLWARLRCRTAELGTYQGGFDAFVKCAEAHLESAGVRIFKDAKKITVDRTRDCWTVAALNHGIQEHDAVVVAASPLAFAQLVGRHAPEHVRSALGQPSLGVQVVILALSQRLGEHYWYSLRREPPGQPFLAAIEHTNFVDARQYDNEHLVYFAKYVPTHSEEWKQTDQQLVDLALLSGRLINPKFSEESLIRSKIFREEYAQPIMGLNASRFVPSIHVHGVPRLFHASMAHVYPWDRGTNYALELGEKVAREVLKSKLNQRK
ncbi:FAD-dependent oxidoreductase [bacterium]|nr:FAD-dependent oxidoreductase [bacterium]